MKTKALVLVTSLVMAMPWGAGASEAPAPSVTRYMVVVTGGELLAGVYADSHTHFLTRTLRPLGLQCVGAMSVDDKRADLMAALGFAAGRAELVLVTGGLGPTVNDITREALSTFTGIALREHPDVLAAMARRFGRSPEELGANLRRQTKVPVGGSYLKNAHGTAVGLVFETKGPVIVALPGPPRELQTMVRDELVPYLNRRFGTRLPGCALTLRFVGLGQSQIDQALSDHVTLPPDVIVNSQFGNGRVDFTFSLADDTSEGRQRLEQLRQAIVKCLGEHIYGQGATTLEGHVAVLLAKRHEKLALIEIGSGGSLVAALNGTPGASDVLAGAYVAPSEEALRHLLAADAETDTNGPAALANAMARATGSQWTLVVGPVRENAGGGRDVEVTLRGPDGQTECWREGLRGSAEMVQWSLTTPVFDRLRRRLH